MQKIGFRKKGNFPALGCAEMLGSCGSSCTDGKSLRAIETQQLQALPVLEKGTPGPGGQVLIFELFYYGIDELLPEVK